MQHFAAMEKDYRRASTAEALVALAALPKSKPKAKAKLKSEQREHRSGSITLESAELPAQGRKAYTAGEASSDTPSTATSVQHSRTTQADAGPPIPVPVRDIDDEDAPSMSKWSIRNRKTVGASCGALNQRYEPEAVIEELIAESVAALDDTETQATDRPLEAPQRDEPAAAFEQMTDDST